MQTLIMIRAIHKLKTISIELLEHSIQVAELTAKILTKEPNLVGDIDPEEVVLAALLHDLGKSYWPKECFCQSYHELKIAHRTFLRTHPITGGFIAKKFGVSEMVIKLIEQHHERLGGTGYPNKIKKPHPAALLIGACDAYAACLEKRPYRPEPLPVFEAVREAAKCTPIVAKRLEMIE